MTHRTLTLMTALALLSVGPIANAQAPAPAPAPKNAAPLPAPTAAPDITVKDTPAAVPTVKSKDSAGNDTLSVDFPDEEIRNILRNVADLFDLNLVIPDTLQGKTSVKLHDVTWRQIFQVVLTPVGYTYIEDGNIIKVLSNESIQQEPVSTEIFTLNYAKAVDIQPTIATLVDSTAGGKIVIDSRSNSLVITERPSRMNRIRPIIEQLDRATDQVMIESKFIEVSDNDIKNVGINWTSLNGYSLTATPPNPTTGFFSYSFGHGITGSTVASGGNNNSGSVTTGTNQAQTAGSTTATTYATTNGALTESSTTGTNGQITSGTTNTGQNTTGTNSGLVNSLTASANSANLVSAVFSGAQFEVILSALQQLNDSKIISNPTVVTLNNTEASINVAQEFPIPEYNFNQQTGTFEVSGFQYKDIGIILKVTPQVNARGFIKLTLAPEVSQSNGTTTFGGASGASIPIIATRKATTQVSLKDGYTMGIGGLLSTNFNKTTNQIPLLGSIPILGYLFKSVGNTNVTDNLIIFITAKTLSAEGGTLEQVFDSNQLRGFQLTRPDLPGVNDGSSPFMEDNIPKKKSFHASSQGGQ